MTDERKDQPKPEDTEKEKSKDSVSPADATATLNPVTDPSTDTVAPPHGTIPPQPADTPSTLAERYELRGLIGEGGMGLVYKAFDKVLEEEIAVKVLQRRFMLNPSDVTRFKREIKTARRITHPNIIRIHDFGIAEREAFISMELLGGGTLADLEQRDDIAFEDKVRISAEIADGLGAAHAEGVIHRDIKPHNVLFDHNGRPKLVDFGIARFATTQTVTAGILGTPHYMSPEQADGLEVDARSDVYALGILMYELFTGTLPFDSESITKLLIMQVNAKPEPPRAIRPELPRRLEAIILRCLDKDPRHRYRDGKALARALREFEEAWELGDDSITDAIPPIPRSKWPYAAAAVVVLGVGTVFGVRALQHMLIAEPTPTPTTTAVAQVSPSVTPTPIVVTATVTSTIVAAPSPTATATPKPTAVVKPNGLLFVIPIPYAEVSANGNPVHDGGRWHWEHVPPGTYDVVAKSEKFGERTKTVRVEPGQTTVVVVRMKEGTFTTDVKDGTNPEDFKK